MAPNCLDAYMGASITHRGVIRVRQLDQCTSLCSIVKPRGWKWKISGFSGRFCAAKWTVATQAARRVKTRRSSRNLTTSSHRRTGHMSNRRLQCRKRYVKKNINEFKERTVCLEPDYISIFFLLFNSHFPIMSVYFELFHITPWTYTSHTNAVVI